MKHSDETLRFIRDYITAHKYPPTRREIQEHLGLASAQGAQRVIDSLERDGAIEVDRGTTRGIRVVKRANMKARTEEM